VALLLFGYSNPILGVLGIMVAYHLIKASSDKTGTAALEQHYPTEEKKWSPFTAIHQFSLHFRARSCQADGVTKV
jgi:hypothetical protein